MEHLLPSVFFNPIFATCCFIFCMFTISLVGIMFFRKPPKGIRITVLVVNGLSWIVTAIACLGMLYRGIYLKLFAPIYIVMYIMRIIASFIWAAVSFDIATNELYRKD